MRVRRRDGRVLLLDPADQLGAGGEGTVYALKSEPGLVAKVYHRPSPEREAKLELMLSNPLGARFSQGDSAQGEGAPPAVCWPQDLLWEEKGAFLGYLMPKLGKMGRIFQAFNPASRRSLFPHFTWRELVRAGLGISGTLKELHDQRYVVGDINESNILVNASGEITFVDADSFRVVDPASGRLFRCPVGKPEYTAPEFQGKSFAEVDQTAEDDRFGLAVLVYQLLLEGSHPFDGIFQGNGEPPLVGERIAAGWYPYGPVGPIRPRPTAPPMTILPSFLADLFRRAFVDGHPRPDARPDARTWELALGRLDESLRLCPKSPLHLFSAHLPACPWCARAALLGRDSFSPEPPAPPRKGPPAPRIVARPAAPTPRAAASPRPAPPAPPPGRTAKSPPILARPIGRIARPPTGWRRTVGLIIAAPFFLAMVLPFLVMGAILLAGLYEKAVGLFSPEDARTAGEHAPSSTGGGTKSPVKTSKTGGGAISPAERQALFAARKVDASPARQAELRTAARDADREAVARLLDTAVPVDGDEGDADGFSPLIHGALSGDPWIVQRLLDAGAKVDFRDNKGRTALFWAAMKGLYPVVEVLLAAGADVDLGNETALTPLMTTTFDGFLHTARALIAAGAPVDDQDQTGLTALHYAAAEGEVEIATLLLDNRARVSQRSKVATTPLTIAAELGSLPMVDLLLARGASASELGKTECTPLMYAVSGGYVAVVERLLEAGADPQQATACGTALKYAKNKEMTALLKQKR